MFDAMVRFPDPLGFGRARAGRLGTVQDGFRYLKEGIVTAILELLVGVGERCQRHQ